jgi:hypothetical protein
VATNYLHAELQCPRCGAIAQQEVEADIDGQGPVNHYRIGDEVDFLPDRPPSTVAATINGYAVCTRCGRDFFVDVAIADGHIAGVRVNVDRRGYID